MGAMPLRLRGRHRLRGWRRPCATAAPVACLGHPLAAVHPAVAVAIGAAIALRRMSRLSTLLLVPRVPLMLAMLLVLGVARLFLRRRCLAAGGCARTSAIALNRYLIVVSDRIRGLVEFVRRFAAVALRFGPDAGKGEGGRGDASSTAGGGAKTGPTGASMAAQAVMQSMRSLLSWSGDGAGSPGQCAGIAAGAACGIANAWAWARPIRPSGASTRPARTSRCRMRRAVTSRA